jgi:hypothetical protein
MNKCPYCQTGIDETSRFCPKCGRAIASPQALDHPVKVDKRLSQGEGHAAETFIKRRRMFVIIAIVGLVVFNIFSLYSFHVGNFPESVLRDRTSDYDETRCPALAGYTLSDVIIPLNGTAELKAVFVNNTPWPCVVFPKVHAVFGIIDAVRLSPERRMITLDPRQEAEFVWSFSPSGLGYMDLRMEEQHTLLIWRDIYVAYTFGLSIAQIRLLTRIFTLIGFITLSIGLYGWIRLELKTGAGSLKKRKTKLPAGASCFLGVLLGGGTAGLLQTNPMLCGVGNLIWCGFLPFVGILIGILWDGLLSVLFDRRPSLFLVITVFFEIGLFVGFIANTLPYANPLAIVGCQ